MLKILSKLCVSKDLASFYTNYQETSRFHFGFVLAVNNEKIAIYLLSPNGEYDGIILLNVEDVFRVETKGKYLEKMRKLYSNDSLTAFNEEIDKNNILNSLLTIAHVNKQVLSVELFDSGCNDIVGFVERIEDRECVIKQVDEYGYEDGFTYISTNDITKLSISRQEEQMILKLWQYNYLENIC